MTERIDHVEQAQSIAEVAATKLSANWESETGERKADMLAVAQLHATLALVEQQRIANDRVQFCPHGDPGMCMSCISQAIQNGLAR